MEIRNALLLHKICKVRIRAVDGLVSFTGLKSIYFSKSSIRLSDNGSHTKSGNLHRRILTMDFPGIDPLDFPQFDMMLKDRYQVLVTLDNNDVYQVASTNFPAELKTKYDPKKGHQLIFTIKSPLPIRYISALSGGDGTNGDGTNENIGFDYELDFKLS